jgi:hypothetical protein
MYHNTRTPRINVTIGRLLLRVAARWCRQTARKRHARSLVVHDVDVKMACSARETPRIRRCQRRARIDARRPRVRDLVDVSLARELLLPDAVCFNTSASVGPATANGRRDLGSTRIHQPPTTSAAALTAEQWGAAYRVCRRTRGSGSRRPGGCTSEADESPTSVAPRSCWTMARAIATRCC